MIEYTGNLFDSKCRIIGHGVNDVGVMGAGIAKQFAQRYPEMYAEYRQQCAEGVELGKVIVHHADDGTIICNMVTQSLPGPAFLDAIARAGHAALAYAEVQGEQRVAIPRIGAGLGGLDWEEVRWTLEQVERNRPVVFEVWSLPEG